ncbi:S8 family serine peptidase [Kingella pumchi]|uniref:S8 family serine peptidase n=1 Tax=Kingella pumchi TaxID=2779506 RepID=A0ABS9NLH5_9NEIS|nr:S8 family serine peptidase [Kingella pumchi]MCG6503640.1 S8 family serine peptidase [Kingella pumchi]
MKLKKNLIAVSISAALLAACGGGGGGSGDDNSRPDTNATPTPNRPKQPQPGNFSQQKDYQKSSDQDRAQADGRDTTILLTDSGVDLTIARKTGAKVDAKMTTTDAQGNVKEVDTKPTADLKNGGLNSHGTNMVEVMMQHGAKGAQIAVGGVNFSQSTDADIIKIEASILSKRDNVAVINHSFSTGEQDYSKLNDYSAVASLFGAMAQQSGALFVSAAGNDGKANPDIDAAIYRINTPLARELEKNWLVATGVYLDGSVIENRCGITKDHCIAAKEFHNVTDVNTKKTGGTIGSSNATAVVSATAARIRSRFDWMRGAELKKTLISTTDDAGAKGNDSTYGVGILNEARALGGYGKVNGQEILNVAGKKREYYFDNDISGSGGIVKNGAASLVLTGNNSYTGTNQIQQGSLVLAGNNRAGNVVTAGGRLTVGANQNARISSGDVLVNGGTLSAETANDFYIDGSLKFNGGTLDKAIGSAVKVSGNADISGNSVLNITGAYSGYATKVGQTETLLTAKNINGSFKVNDKTNGLIENQVNQNSSAITVSSKRNEVGKVVPASAYEGAGRDARKLEQVFAAFDQAAEQGSLNDGQLAAARIYTQSRQLTETLFAQGTDTHLHSQHNQIDTDMMQNERFAEKLGEAAGQNGAVWLDYTGSASRLKMDGISGKSRDYGIGVGASHAFGRHLIAAGANRLDNRWEERFGSVEKTVKTEGYGLDLGYGYAAPHGIGIYGTLGWNKLKDAGKLYSFGVGVNKTFMLSSLALKPEFSLQYAKADAKNIDVSATQYLDGMNTKATAAKLGISALYSFNDQLTVFGKAGLARDLQRKTAEHTTVKNTGISVALDSSDKKTRFNLAAGAAYSVSENWKLGLALQHIRASHWHNSSVNAQVKYRF